MPPKLSAGPSPIRRNVAVGVATKIPTLDEILEQESRLDVDALTEAAGAKKETTKILL